MKTFCTLLSLIVLAGCGAITHPSTDPVVSDSLTPAEIKAIDTIGADAADAGLNIAAQEAPDTTKTIATQLSSNIGTIALPYLNSNPIDAGTVVTQTMNTGLFKGLPQGIQSALLGASGLLGLYISIPSEANRLPAKDLQALQVYLAALKRGCDSFLGGRALRHPVLKMVKPTTFIDWKNMKGCFAVKK